MSPHGFATGRLIRLRLDGTNSPCAPEEDAALTFDSLLDEIEEEELTEVFGEFLVPIDE